MSDSILNHFNNLKSLGLNIDITRGKPESKQLDLSNNLLKMEVDPYLGVVDLRNYGEPLGLIEARSLGADLLGAPVENIITGEQSSLLLSYQVMLSNYLFGSKKAWKNINSPKFICPVPGFDRHFRMFEDLGIEMITIPLVDDGVCIESLTEVLQNETDVVGMICVPRHSNPSGEVYSDNNILEIFEVSKNYSEDFLVLFDNAYLVHDFLPTRKQSDVWKLAQQVNAENNAVVVTSFSKVTFGGGGLSFLAASGKNLELIKRMRASMVICPDKINQKKHIDFFKDKNSIIEHMKNHADLIRPKFELSYKILEKLSSDYGTFSKPTGGYFITYKTNKSIATKVVDLCKSVGVLITPAGATFPYGQDPLDNIIRIAPTFVDEENLVLAMDVFITAVQVAHHDLIS
jgi:DNA-binding transcriptional MocR family regulator